MQETVFNLNERPFSSDIRVERYFPGESIENARVAIARTIERAEGCSLIVGPPGSGKTMLCYVLAEQFRDQFDSVLLAGGRLPSRKSLLQAILYELGLPYRRMDEGELRLSLIDHLSPREGGPQGMLLLVDEAHTLSPKLLEELRLLTNLVRQGSPRVRLVLAGGAVLEERFASPKLAAFNQRLTARGYLEPFSSDETLQFIRAQLAAAGGEPDQIFTEKALRAIHRATDGVVRLVNQLCDHALLLAAAGSQGGEPPQAIDEPGVDEAWADLQQLPMPWNMDRAPEGPLGEEPATTVEFGSLDDDLEDFSDDDSSQSAPVVPFTPAEAAISDPSDQLDQIQGQLDQVEDDFQPVGSAGPEVELAFDNVSDPFGEDYDRTASSDRFRFDPQTGKDSSPLDQEDAAGLAYSADADSNPASSEPDPLADPMMDESGWETVSPQARYSKNEPESQFNIVPPPSTSAPSQLDVVAFDPGSDPVLPPAAGAREVAESPAAQPDIVIPSAQPLKDLSAPSSPAPSFDTSPPAAESVRAAEPVEQADSSAPVADAIPREPVPEQISPAELERSPGGELPQRQQAPQPGQLSREAASQPKTATSDPAPMPPPTSTPKSAGRRRYSQLFSNMRKEGR